MVCSCSSWKGDAQLMIENAMFTKNCEGFRQSPNGSNAKKREERYIPLACKSLCFETLQGNRVEKDRGLC